MIFALAFQGIAALPGLGLAKPYLLPKQFTAWSLFRQGGESIGRACFSWRARSDESRGRAIRGRIYAAP